MVLGSPRPPIDSNDASGRIVTMTRPDRSPNFSPSLAKTSSMRRWMAHCWVDSSGVLAFAGSDRSGSGRGSSDMRSDPRPRRRRVGREGVEALGLLEHALLHV